MTKSRQKHLERIHIIRTLINYGPLSAVELAYHCNTECDHDALEALPEINPRGITMKLQGMSLDGLVDGTYGPVLPPPGPMQWSATEKGHKASETFEVQERVRQASLELALASREPLAPTKETNDG